MEGQFAIDIDVGRVGAGFLRQRGIIGDAAKFDFHGCTSSIGLSPESPPPLRHATAAMAALSVAVCREFQAVLDYRAWAEFDVRSVAVRSEEHTSELQSRMRISYAFFCLRTNKT